MNDKTKQNIKHLIKDGQLLDNEEKLLLKSFVLTNNINEEIEYTPDELSELTIYIDPLQAIIDAHEATIERLTEQLVKANAPTLKTSYNRLTKEEVREIEQIFEKDPNTDRNLIISTYNTSQPIVSKISRGTHTKSSELFKSTIMREMMKKLD